MTTKIVDNVNISSSNQTLSYEKKTTVCHEIPFSLTFASTESSGKTIEKASYPIDENINEETTVKTTIAAKKNLKQDVEENLYITSQFPSSQLKELGKFLTLINAKNNVAITSSENKEFEKNIKDTEEKIKNYFQNLQKKEEQEKQKKEEQEAQIIKEKTELANKIHNDLLKEENEKEAKRLRNRSNTSNTKKVKQKNKTKNKNKFTPIKNEKTSTISSPLKIEKIKSIVVPEPTKLQKNLIELTKDIHNDTSIPEHKRIKRWKTKSPNQWRSFKDYKNGVESRHYLNLTDEELYEQRARHYLPGIQRLISMPHFSNAYWEQSNDGPGMYAQLYFNGQIHNGAVYFGIGGNIYHKYFVNEDNDHFLSQFDPIDYSKDHFKLQNEDFGVEINQQGVITFSYAPNHCISIFPVDWKDLINKLSTDN